MPFKTFITVLFFTTIVAANDGAAPTEGHGAPAETQNAAAAEGHAGAGTAGAASKETFESGRQSMEWVDLVNKVGAAKSKVEAQRSVMLQLLEQKKTIEKQEALTKHVAVMSEENKKLHKLIDEYEEQRNLLQYRFPEKGITELRKYERVEKTSLEEFETEISVEGQLKKNVGKMKKQFKTPPEKKTTFESDDAAAKAVRPSKPKSQAKPVEEPDSITSSIKIVK